MLVLFPLVLLLLLPVIWCCYLARALGIPQWREGALGMQWFGHDGAEHWELQWLKKHEDGAPYGRGFSQYGITGFARVISRSSGQAICGTYIRAHLCYHNPCQADWKHDTKYGDLPRPLHFQRSEDWRVPSPPPPPPPPPPAVVYGHAVGAPLGAEGGDDAVSEGGAGGDDDDVAEGDPESSSSSSSSSRGSDEVHSYHIAG